MDVFPSPLPEFPEALDASEEAICRARPKHGFRRENKKIKSSAQVFHRTAEKVFEAVGTPV
jgi:hypothetical protein